MPLMKLVASPAADGSRLDFFELGDDTPKLLKSNPYAANPLPAVAE